jgi:hypothetical protein
VRSATEFGRQKSPDAAPTGLWTLAFD